MTGLLIVIGWLLVVLVVSELALSGRKLQTGLARAVAAWGAVYVACVVSVTRQGDIAPVALTIFWGGAFLSWFGLRSHVESSILLRMLYVLKRGPMTRAQILDEYASHYGEATRVEELIRGGLASRTNGQLSASAKGKTILSIVARLR